jgi:hypothetical protein
LQAYCAKIRFAHLLGDAGQLNIEGNEGVQIVAHGRWREQNGEAAVWIAFAGDAPYGVTSLGLVQGSGLSL